MKAWHYDSACDVDQPLVDRLRRFPREPDMLVYGVRALIALIIRGWLRIYHRFEIIGHENLRTNRSLVIVANHSSHLDTLCLLAALPLGNCIAAFPAAAADYFFQSVPRTFVAAVVTNALPFARRVRVRRSLSICSKLLSDPENILIIFPEGTRSETGETRNSNRESARSSPDGRHRSALYLQGALSRVAEGQASAASKKVRLIVGAPRNYSSRSANKIDICTIAANCIAR